MKGDNNKNNIMKTYKGFIKSLPDNGIFCFGSNPEGRHGKGAAATAKMFFGAKYGQGKGLMGRSYGIVTKDLRKSKHPSISSKEIKHQIIDLYLFAIENPQLDFYIVYSGKGTNLNGYSNEAMARMFSCTNIPNNIVFEEEFSKLLTIN